LRRNRGLWAAFGIGLVVLSLTARAESPARAASSRESPQSHALFDFHSGFWVNLHHFLYAQATAQKGPKSSVPNEEDMETLSSLAPQQLAIWNAAIAYYTGSLIQHDLLLDQDLPAIKEQLENAEGSPNLAHAEIPAGLKAVLLEAAPIYRRLWWKRHDAQNRRWIAQVQPLLGKYGDSLRDSLIKIYGVPWPGYPVRVDTVAYANWAGAYTTIEPTRPTISTTDPGNQKSAALEILFHETSHGMMDKVRNAFETAEANVNARRPSGPFQSGTLWHAVLFYTAGDLVADRITGYVPYADKKGLWILAWPDPDRSLIERDWKPHMNGALDLQQAVSQLVEDLATIQR
jgi:hypothetical protein